MSDSFVAGQIVRPKLTFPSVARTGELRDFRQLVSGQAWVIDKASAPGGGLNSESWWDRASSSTRVTNSTDDVSHVVVWDCSTGTFVEQTYPDEMLELGSVDGQPLGGIYPANIVYADPRVLGDAGSRVAALCRARDGVLP